ncbi:MAG: sulfatase-like hydrolase/transferase [Bacteroidota bacterium]
MRNIFFCLLLSISFGGCANRSLQTKELPPHILLIYVDDMGLGDASFMGNDFIPTPHIDKMTKGGKVFEQYYTNSPVCSPSRVAITTGMYPLRWNINSFLSHKKHNDLCDQAGFLDVRAPSIAKRLKQAGYKTAHFGKWHMGGGRRIEAPAITEYGFDTYVSTWESPDPDPLLTSSNWIWARSDSIKRWERTKYFVDNTLAFLQEHRNASCYINLWPDDIHTPWVGSKEELEKGKKNYKSEAHFYTVMADFDQEGGRLIAGIEEMGLDKRTLIIFTSDNGPAPTFNKKRTLGLRGSKNSLYEGGIRMPFIAYWPTVIEGGQVDQKSVLSAIDLYPTLCRIGGIEPPKEWEFDGEDVSKAMLGSNIHARQSPIYWEYGRINPRTSIPKDSLNRSLPLSIRQRNWKFFTSFEGNEAELYELGADPQESKDLSEQHPKLVEELREKALSWFQVWDKSEVR